MNSDAVLADLLELIGRYGWAVRRVQSRVGEEGPPFAYTVGLTAMGHPEVVVWGLPGEVAQEFLNDLGAQVRDGAAFPVGTVTTALATDDRPMAFIAVRDSTELTAVEQVYGSVSAVQLGWSVQQGRLPWERGYSLAADAQPLRGAPLGEG